MIFKSMTYIFTASILVASNIVHALPVTLEDNGEILHYSVGGIMRFADTDYGNQYTTEIYGDMYISNINLSADPTRTAFYDIVSFAIVAGEYGWGGSGEIKTYNRGSLLFGEAHIFLDGTGDWDMYTGGDTPNHVKGWENIIDLPEEISWPGFGWYYGEEYYSRIASLNMKYVSSVPEPSIIWLLGSGLALIGFARRKA